MSNISYVIKELIMSDKDYRIVDKDEKLKIIVIEGIITNNEMKQDYNYYTVDFLKQFNYNGDIRKIHKKLNMKNCRQCLNSIGCENCFRCRNCEDCKNCHFCENLKNIG